MDQRSNSSEKHHYYHEGSKQHEAIQSLKNCVQYIVQLFKICHANFKQFDENMSLPQYCHFMEKMLKKLVGLIPKQMITNEAHNKAIKEFDEINENYQNLLKDKRDYKCEINVLQNQLAEAEKREQALIEQRQKQKRYTKQFEKKLGEAKRDSQSKLQRIPHSDDLFKSRKQSLPLIVNNGHKGRVGPKNSLHSIHMLASPTEQEKTQRLVEHLRKKY